jgi:hypothetical protein
MVKESQRKRKMENGNSKLETRKSKLENGNSGLGWPFERAKRLSMG